MMQTTSFEHGLSRIDLNLNHRRRGDLDRNLGKSPWPIPIEKNFHQWFLNEYIIFLQGKN